MDLAGGSGGDGGRALGDGLGGGFLRDGGGGGDEQRGKSSKSTCQQSGVEGGEVRQGSIDLSGDAVRTQQGSIDLSGDALSSVGRLAVRPATRSTCHQILHAGRESDVHKCVARV